MILKPLSVLTPNPQRPTPNARSCPILLLHTHVAGHDVHHVQPTNAADAATEHGPLAEGSASVGADAVAPEQDRAGLAGMVADGDGSRVISRDGDYQVAAGPLEDLVDHPVDL